MDALPDDNDSTLPGFSVYQTPVLEASRCSEREAERRRELPRVARREQHAGVHVAGTVVLRGGSGGEGPRVEEHLRWAAGLGFGHNELRRLLYARKRRSEEHTSELQSRSDLVCRLLLEKKKR